MLSRILEPEVMDSQAEALAYDQMDHAEVNRMFVDDLLAMWGGSGDILDLGTGTARIPVEICKRSPDATRVVAVDLSTAMLDLARIHIELEQCIGRVRLDCQDAKALKLPDGSFAAVVSNSLMHHLAEPYAALAEAVRVVQPGGLLFVRDLCRPDSLSLAEQLVARYAGPEEPLAQSMFRQSLLAALTVAEVRSLVGELGFPPQTVQGSSDRHWTWSATKPVV